MREKCVPQDLLLSRSLILLSFYLAYLTRQKCLQLHKQVVRDKTDLNFVEFLFFYLPDEFNPVIFKPGDDIFYYFLYLRHSLWILSGNFPNEMIHDFNPMNIGIIIQIKTLLFNMVIIVRLVILLFGLCYPFAFGMLLHGKCLIELFILIIHEWKQFLNNFLAVSLFQLFRAFKHPHISQM